MPRVASRSISSVLARLGPCSRRMPVIQPSASSSARSSAATLAAEQQFSGPVQGPLVLVASCTSMRTPKRSSKALQVLIVSSKSTPLSIVTTLTAVPVFSLTRSSSSRSTDSSFWKEHRSTARSPCLALAVRSVSVRPVAGSSDSVGLRMSLWVGFMCPLRMRVRSALDGALPLTAFDLERGAAAPVYEFVHRLQAKIDRQREILDHALELARANALGKRGKALPVCALRLVVAQPALDRLRHALGGQAQLQARTERDRPAFVVAAHVRDVGGDRVLAHFDRRSVEADVGDVVLGAAVGAAAHL